MKTCSSWTIFSIFILLLVASVGSILILTHQVSTDGAYAYIVTYVAFGIGTTVYLIGETEGLGDAVVFFGAFTVGVILLLVSLLG